MNNKLDETIQKGKVLMDQYVEDLYQKIDKTEEAIDDFYTRMKVKIKNCRAELTMTDERKHLETLDFKLDASSDVDEKESTLKSIRNSIQNLPRLEKNQKFEEFLKQDHCPIKLHYNKKNDDIKHGSDFEFEDNSPRQISSESLNDDLNQKKSFQQKNISVSHDHVDSKIETKIVSSYQSESNISGENLYGAIQKEKRGETDKKSHSAKMKPESVISDDVSKFPISGQKQFDEYTGHDDKITLRGSTQIRAAGLDDLTEHPKYNLIKREEIVHSFPEIKHQLPGDRRDLASSKTALDLNETEEGDIEFSTCTDVELFDTFIISVSGEHIIKSDKATNKVLGKLELKHAGQMCPIRSYKYICVIQTNIGIAIIKTDPDLKFVYKIKTSKPYTNICHVDTFLSTPKDVPDPNFIFGLVYTDTANPRGKGYPEKVDFVRAKATVFASKSLKYDAQEDSFDVTPFHISGISGIGAAWKQGSLKIVLGCAAKIICLETSNPQTKQIKKAWEIVITKASTDVVCVKSMAYICIQDEGRVMLVDMNGDVKNENVLQGLLKCRPHKISVYKDTYLVKSFEESRWKCPVFAR